MTDMNKLKEELLQLLKSKGAALAGVADLSGYVEDDKNIGISIAVPWPANFRDYLRDPPMQEYNDMRSAINAQLDEIAKAGVEFLEANGFDAAVNVPKFIGKRITALPYKMVATKAGLGWIGKNCLLVTEEYGSAVRLSSLLTNAPLPADEPIEESRCGSCKLCVEKCPTNALKGTLWKAGMSRDEIFDIEECKLVKGSQPKPAPGAKKPTCGLCFADCAYTQRYIAKYKKRT